MQIERLVGILSTIKSSSMKNGIVTNLWHEHCENVRTGWRRLEMFTIFWKKVCLHHPHVTTSYKTVNKSPPTKRSVLLLTYYTIMSLVKADPNKQGWEESVSMQFLNCTFSLLFCIQADITFCSVGIPNSL